MLNAVGAYENLTAGLNKPNEVSATGWDLNLLHKSEKPRNIYKISLPQPADKFITATAAWNKHYNNVYPFEPNPEKDANLRLELWAINPQNHSNDYLLDYSDSSADNLEHIYCRADANYTNYEIVLSYSNISGPNQPDSAQRYGLAWKTSKKQNSDSFFWYDLNADGIVNESDFAVLLNSRLASFKPSESYLLGDVNIDGAIDANDLIILLNHEDLQADWHTTEKNTPK